MRDIPADSQDAFTDILFNALLGFAFMFVVAFLMVRPVDMTGKINPHAEFLITAQWADEHPDDIDLLVEDGVGNVVWFDVREAGLMHLDRDDRGRLGDAVVVNGKRFESPLNQETVTLRGIAAGEYVVNVLHYKAVTGLPVDVTVKVEKLNPVATLAYAGRVTLTGAGDERTVVRFTLDATGQVTDLSQRGKLLLTARGDKSGGDAR